MRIVFDAENGLVVPDGKALEKAEEIVSNNQDIVIGSGILIHAICYVLYKDETTYSAKYKSIVFVYKGKELFLNSNCQLSENPIGFCDTDFWFVQDICNIMMERLMKKEKNKISLGG